MITLYTWTTPNGRKISVALEEMGLAYEVKPVNIGADEQFAPAFLAISPNNKIPGIVDHGAPGGPVSVFESGAILVYLAEKSGKFLPASGPARASVLEWLFWQVGGIGPMFGQLLFFAVRAPERLPLAVDRFQDEAVRPAWRDGAAAGRGALSGRGRLLDRGYGDLSVGFRGARLRSRGGRSAWAHAVAGPLAGGVGGAAGGAAGNGGAGGLG